MIFRVTWIIIFISENAASQLYTTETETLPDDYGEFISEVAGLVSTRITTSMSKPASTTPLDIEKYFTIEEGNEGQEQSREREGKKQSKNPHGGGSDPQKGNRNEKTNQQKSLPRGGNDPRKRYRGGKKGQQKNHEAYREEGNDPQKNSQAEEFEEPDSRRGRGRHPPKNHRAEEMEEQEFNRGGGNNAQKQSQVEEIEQQKYYHRGKSGEKTDSGSAHGNEDVEMINRNPSNSTITNAKLEAMSKAVEDTDAHYGQIKILIIAAIVLQVLLTIAGVSIIVAVLHLKFEQLHMAVEIIPDTYQPRSQYYS